MEGAGDWRRLPAPASNRWSGASSSSRRNEGPPDAGRHAAPMTSTTTHPRAASASQSTTSLHTNNMHNNNNSSSEEDSRLSAFVHMQELSKLLECPVCYEIALPPVVMCTLGHNICSDCRKQCGRCPICRSAFCEARNRLAENIVEKCSIACKYRSSGCNQVLNGSRMATHIDQECEFRPVLCRDCKVKIPYDEYINHLINVERLPKQIATECSTGFDIEDEDFAQSALGGIGQSWEPTWLHCYDIDFFCHLESVPNYWWIYVIGFAPDSVLENYLCDILVWNRDKQQEFRFHGPIHAYRKTGDEILASGQCLITSENSIRSVLNEGGIDVVVCIIHANSYRAPTSRNTGQPIYSPLTLRLNNNNNNTGNDGNTNNNNVYSSNSYAGNRIPATHTVSLTNIFDANNNGSRLDRSYYHSQQDGRSGAGGMTSIMEGENHHNEFNSDVEDDPSQILNNSNNNNNNEIHAVSPSTPANAPVPPPRHGSLGNHGSAVENTNNINNNSGPGRHRISRIDQAPHHAPTRSRSLDGGRRRRHHRHNNNNNNIGTSTNLGGNHNLSTAQS